MKEEGRKLHGRCADDCVWAPSSLDEDEPMVINESWSSFNRMLETAKEARVAEVLKQEENIQLLKNEMMKAFRELEEEIDHVISLLHMKYEEIMRQMKEKELELANTRNAATVAEAARADLGRQVNSTNDMACRICLTNKMNVAFGCGHMSCAECMLRISNCHMCRQPRTSYLKLFLN